MESISQEIHTGFVLNYRNPLVSIEDLNSDEGETEGEPSASEASVLIIGDCENMATAVDIDVDSSLLDVESIL